MDKGEGLITLLQKSRRCVVLTGAGISTLSGIPDFRGKNGFYKRTDIDTEKIFNIEYFRKDPAYYYTHARDFIYNLADKTPNIVHTELARLEKIGVVQAILTQNIDLLHQKAGSQRVLELHGSPSLHHCLQCGAQYSFEQIVQILESGAIPSCEHCGGIVKPDIIFFGEALNLDILEESEELAQKADLILVLGSSLTVYPAASLPGFALHNGGKLALVNADPTPLDQVALWKHTDLEQVFTTIRERFL